VGLSDWWVLVDLRARVYVIGSEVIQEQYLHFNTIVSALPISLFFFASLSFCLFCCLFLSFSTFVVFIEAIVLIVAFGFPFIRPWW